MTSVADVLNAGEPLPVLDGRETTRFLLLAERLRVALEGYEAETETLSDTHELFRIGESNASPSFRFCVGHLRQIIAFGDVSA